MSSRQGQSGGRKAAGRGAGAGDRARVTGQSPAGARGAPPTGRGADRNTDRRTGRAADGKARQRRQVIAVASVAVALVVVVAAVLVSQALQAGPGALKPDRHSLGSPDAPVTIWEWSDFQ